MPDLLHRARGLDDATARAVLGDVADDPVDNDLSRREIDRLLDLLGLLAQYLNAPGDWGHDTCLGRFTVRVLSLRQHLRALAQEAGDG